MGDPLVEDLARGVDRAIPVGGLAVYYCGRRRAARARYRRRSRCAAVAWACRQPSHVERLERRACRCLPRYQLRHSRLRTDQPRSEWRLFVGSHGGSCARIDGRNGHRELLCRRHFHWKHRGVSHDLTARRAHSRADPGQCRRAAARAREGPESAGPESVSAAALQVPFQLRLFPEFLPTYLA